MGSMIRTVTCIGFVSGILAVVFTICFVIAQVLQLYGIIVYPLDEKLIYGFSLAIVIPLLFLFLALHYSIAPQKQFWTGAALMFAGIYAIFVTANYVVQLGTVIPTSLKGKLDEVRIFQQTPHSMFWNFDAVGYICLGIASLMLSFAFGVSKSQKQLRFSLIAHAASTLAIAYVYFTPSFNSRILLLAFPWAITAPWFMTMLTYYFRPRSAVRDYNELDEAHQEYLQKDEQVTQSGV